MNPIRTIRRLASTLAGLAAATLAVIAAAPAALARPGTTRPGPGRYRARPRHPHRRHRRHARLADHHHRGWSRGPRRRAGIAPRPGMGSAAARAGTKRLTHARRSRAARPPSRPRGPQLQVRNAPPQMASQHTPPSKNSKLTPWLNTPRTGLSARDRHAVGQVVCPQIFGREVCRSVWLTHSPDADSP